MISPDSDGGPLSYNGWKDKELIAEVDRRYPNRSSLSRSMGLDRNALNLWMSRKKLPRHGRAILRLVLERDDARRTTAADLERRLVAVEKLTTGREQDAAP